MRNTDIFIIYAYWSSFLFSFSFKTNRHFIPDHQFNSEVLLNSFLLTSTRTNLNENYIDSSLTFRDYNLPEWLIDRCEELGFTSPTEVQRMGLPLVLEGKDVILQSQTGSGKTLLFALPILANVDPNRAAIQAVIVVPSRELGLQVASVFKTLSSSYNKQKLLSGTNGSAKSKISIMSIFEGSNNRRQQIWATAEPPHIIIGTVSDQTNLLIIIS